MTVTNMTNMTVTNMTVTKRMVRAGIGTSVTLLVALGLAGAGPAFGQSKEMSDKSVQTMMQYAWSLMLPKFTANGKEVVVDLTKPKENMVSVDAAREVIKIGRISASAQLCGLVEEQSSVHATMVKREVEKKTWSDQQMMFINQLHLFTVMLMTGGVKVVERDEKDGGKDGGKEVVIDNAKLAPPKNACTAAESKKVQDAVKAYIEAAPAAKKL